METPELKRRDLIKFGAAAVAAVATTTSAVATVTTNIHQVPRDPELHGPQLKLEGEPGTIRQQHRFKATVAQVWTSLTDTYHLNNWFGIQSKVTPGVNGTMRHSWGDPVIEESKILIWEPNARLKVEEITPFGVTFQPSDGPSRVRTLDYVLTAEDQETVVDLVYSGFGKTPEWQRFQAAVASCEVYQMGALGHYVTNHYGEKRSVAWARNTFSKSYTDMWSLLTGEKGILTEGSFSGLKKGDHYSFRTITGDVFEGEVMLHVPTKQFAATVENLNNSLLRITLDRPGGDEAYIWLASWGENAAANQMFEWRWEHALQSVLS